MSPGSAATPLLRRQQGPHLSPLIIRNPNPLAQRRLQKTAEAALLLDAGGDTAVTLRAVAQAVGVSHNAPYRHFKDRSTLLAAIAERDFGMLAVVFH